MPVAPAEFRLAFEDFLNDLDDRGTAFDWSLADVKREFVRWLMRGEREPPPFGWNDLLEYEAAVAMSARYQPYRTAGGRWFR